MEYRDQLERVWSFFMPYNQVKFRTGDPLWVSFLLATNNNLII